MSSGKTAISTQNSGGELGAWTREIPQGRKPFRMTPGKRLDGAVVFGGTTGRRSQLPII